MEYIKLFQNHSEYENFVSGGTMEKPNVSHCIEENDVHYNQKTWADEYLTFDIVTAGTIVWKTTRAQNVKTISYSINDGEWTEITPSITGISFNVSVGDKVRFKGNNTAYGVSTLSYNTFDGSTASFNVQGNIMSLTNGDLFTNATTFESDYVFVYLFKNTNIINTKNLILPVTILANYCYYGIFSGCSTLITFPELPATTLADYCYASMFRETSLTTTPELPLTTLTSNCYASMFYDCSSLIIAPELPATTLAQACYYQMFDGCTSLTTTPALPATTVASSCYASMFSRCTSLVNIPSILPAETLANSCYSSMFASCTSLITPPELPATTLADYCYSSMFQNCTNLISAPELPATTLGKYCYRQMFYKCTSLVTAPELPATTLLEECYKFMFEDCTSLNSITCLATDKSALSCTYAWVRGVAASGTFTKAASMTNWPTGISGIPDGWTVQDAS